MAKLSLALAATLAACSTAFAPSKGTISSTSLPAATFDSGDDVWDPMSLSKLGTGEAFDTFPNMFPDKQFLAESEIKQGRMAMLAWTGIWATHQGGFGLGLHFPGFPDEPDWTKALGTFAAEQPVWFGAILGLICIAEGESVGHSGDNFRGKSTKKIPGDLGYDPLGLKTKLSPEKFEYYRGVEVRNGRAAMIAMASMFAFESIPGSVPLMDLFGAQ